jgi:hypothetical protein
MIIKAGTHAPMRWPKLIYGMSPLRYEITFTPSCAYYIGADQSDINKLFGIGYWPHHRHNSVRFGWRYSSSNYIDIFAYFYKDGERFWQMIGRVGMNIPYTFIMMPSGHNHTMQILGRGIHAVVPVKPSKFAYLLGSYFGGNRVAPHDIEIKMTRL